MPVHKSAAIALVAGAIAGLTTMAFHPTGHDVLRNAAAGVANTRTAAVHSLAIAAQLLVLMGTLVFTLRSGVRRDVAVAGYIVFAVATFAGIIAAVASGFLAPSVLRGYAEADEAGRAVMLGALHYTGQVNQAFAKVYAALSGVAILLWSLAILMEGELSRGLAAYGALLGIALTAGIVSGYAQVNLHGFGLIVLGQAVWLVWVAILSWRSVDGFRSP